MLKFKFPDAVFQRYIQATGKDAAYVLNRTLRNIGFNAAKNTPKKKPEAIEAELRKDKIGLKIATKQLTRKKGTSYTTKKGKTRTIKRVSRRQIATKTRQLFARRKKRTGFMRQGWIAALISAGIPIRGSGERPFRGGKSKIGSGKQATEKHLHCYLGNAVYGRLDGKAQAKGRRSMQAALQKAVRHVAQDMTKFAREKMGQTARKYSARRGR